MRAPIRSSAIARTITPLIGLGVGAAVIWVLHRQLDSVHLKDVAEHIGRLPWDVLAGACALMIAAYAGAVAMDVQALRYLGRSLTYRRIALASFVGSALGNCAGFALLSGGSVRYRLYADAGVSAYDVGKIMTFNGVTYWTGLLSLAGTVLLFEWPLPHMLFDLSAVHARLLGAAALGLVAAYLVWSASARRPLKLWQWQVRPPPLSTALGQVALALAEWVLSTGVLLILLPDDGGLEYGEFVSIFLLAQLGTLVSHVPGGIGVFDSIILLALPPTIAPAAALAALLVYRAIYYLLPLAAAAMLWIAYEAKQRG